MTFAPPLLVIAGATATGKTGLAVRTAVALRVEGIPAEVISADSRQVFTGLDIGTAKVTLAERQDVPHHGLDLVEPDQAFSIADFNDHVATVLPPIAAGGGVAILVGGTGLYLRAIARGIDTDALPSDPAIRAGIEADLLEVGVEVLAERLRTIASIRAAGVDLRNPRRVVRALEIATIDGGASRLPERRGYPGRVAWLGLAADPERHQIWIMDRVRAQFEGNLLCEAAALRERYDPTLPAFSAIAYREAWAALDGTMTTDEAVIETARRSVAFAKRQRTWFRREPDIDWHDATDPTLDEHAVLAARKLLG